MKSRAKITAFLALILLASTASGCALLEGFTRGPDAPIEGLAVCPTLNYYELPDLEKVTLVRKVPDGYVISFDMWDTTLDNLAKLIQHARKQQAQIEIYGTEYPIAGLTDGTRRR